jgi:hypothetical protein
MGRQKRTIDEENAGKNFARLMGLDEKRYSMTTLIDVVNNWSMVEVSKQNIINYLTTRNK